MAFTHKHRGTTYYNNHNPNQQQFPQNGFNPQAYNQQQQSPQTNNQQQEISQTNKQQCATQQTYDNSYKHRGTTYYFSQNPNQQQFQQNGFNAQASSQQQQIPQTNNQQQILQTYNQQQQSQQTHNHQQQTQQKQFQQTYNQHQQTPQIAYQQQVWAPMNHQQLTKNPQNKSYLNNYAGKGIKTTKTQLPSNASYLIQPRQDCCVLIRSSSAKMYKKDLDYVFRHYRPNYLGSRVVKTIENQKTMFEGIAYFDNMFTGSYLKYKFFLLRNIFDIYFVYTTLITV